MIKAIDVLTCTSVEVESDAYIPLTITWATDSSLQPLYWRISGSNGGEVEIKVDPRSGIMRELVVIDEPPGTFDTSTPGSIPKMDTGIPVFDRSSWGISTNPDCSKFQSRVITSREVIAFSRKQRTARLIFPAKQTARVLVCGNSQIHLAGDGSLSAVVVNIQPDT
jgi:hypothetical protein